MRLLVLGGTSFVGRAIVENAPRHGVDVTLFNRGRTGVELFPGVTRLTGDRAAGDCAALGEAMHALGDRVRRYLFISSHAVYARTGVGPGSDESAPRRQPVRHVRRPEDLDDDTYGPSKVACEDDVLARYGSRATIVRPGKVAGPTTRRTG